MPERVVVTGGAGFIGSHVVDALVERDAGVLAVDDLSQGSRENLAGALAAGARLHEADVRDAAAMRDLLADERPDAVLHLAAQVSVTRSVADPEHDADVNVRGTAVVLEAARLAGVPRFVYVSTGGALYGEADEFPTPEGAAIRPLAPYGQSKFAGEGYSALYGRLHGMSTASLRLGNVYGPRQDPYGEAGVIAIFCRSLLDGARPTVFGDGLQTRDYVYVGDVARAIVAAAGSKVEGPFNIGRGRETTVLELVEALREAADTSDFRPEHAPPRAGEARRSCLDSSRAERELGWTAQTDLGDGLRATLRGAAAPGPPPPSA